jgi:hypothetical protein
MRAFRVQPCLRGAAGKGMHGLSGLCEQLALRFVQVEACPGGSYTLKYFASG